MTDCRMWIVGAIRIFIQKNADETLISEHFRGEFCASLQGVAEFSSETKISVLFNLETVVP